MTIGERIKNARESAGITQVELGERVGVSGVAIMRYEKNQREPRLEQLRQIASALGVSYWDLIPDPKPGEEEDPSIMEEILRDFPYQTEFGPMSAKDVDRAISHLQKKRHLSDLDRRLLSAYAKLDHSGQRKVADYAEDILPRYQASRPSSPAPEGTDTAPAPEGSEGPQEGKG